MGEHLKNVGIALGNADLQEVTALIWKYLERSLFLPAVGHSSGDGPNVIFRFGSADFQDTALIWKYLERSLFLPAVGHSSGDGRNVIFRFGSADFQDTALIWKYLERSLFLGGVHRAVDGPNVIVQFSCEGSLRLNLVLPVNRN